MILNVTYVYGLVSRHPKQILLNPWTFEFSVMATVLNTNYTMQSNISDQDILNTITNANDVSNNDVPMVNPFIQYAAMIEAAQVILNLRSFGLFAIGFTGGIMTLIVLNRANLPRNGMYQYLTTIAVCDCIHQLLNAIYNITIYLSASMAWFCRGAHFLAYVSTFTSDVVVMVVAIDRAIAVVIPHKSKALSTPGRVRIVIICIFLFECAESLQTLWTYDAGPDLKMCIRDFAYVTVMQVFGYFGLARSCLIFCVLVVSNTIIIYQLRKQRHLMKSLQGKGDDDAKQAAKKDRQIAAMLVSISILFIVTSLPYLMLLLSNSIFGWTKFGIYYVILYNLFLSIASFLKSTNHALNFFMYCFSAQFFRNEVKKLFCGDKQGDSSSSGSEDTRNTSA